MINGNHIGTGRIVSFHDNFILSIQLQSRTYFESESAIATFMRAYQLSIDVDFGTGSHTFETKKDTVTR